MEILARDNSSCERRDLVCLEQDWEIIHDESLVCVQPAQDLGEDANIVGGICAMCRWMLGNLRFIFDQFSFNPGDGSPSIEIPYWGAKKLLAQASHEGCRLCERTLLECYGTHPDNGQDWNLGTVLNFGPRDALLLCTFQRRPPGQRSLIKSALNLYIFGIFVSFSYTKTQVFKAEMKKRSARPRGPPRSTPRPSTALAPKVR